MSRLDCYVSDGVNPAPILNFDRYADAIAGLVDRQQGPGAFVFAIHGPWGSGKSTLMAAVADRLTSRVREDGVRPLLVEFNAWKFQDKEALWRALLLRVVGEVQSQGVLNEEQSGQLRAALYRAFEVDQVGSPRLNYKSVALELASAVFGMAHLGFLGKVVDGLRKSRRTSRRDEAGQKREMQEMLGVFEREVVATQIDRISSIEQFLKEFEKLVGAVKASGRSLCVLVDDLDRCLPEATLSVFEAIKLFMDVQGVTFIIALDREAVRKAVIARYRPAGSDAEPLIDADEYVEKVISISFQIPPMAGPLADQYLDSLALTGRWTPNAIAILRSGLQANPRRWKRFVNTAEFALHLVESGRGSPLGNLEIERVLKLQCVAYRWSPFFDLISLEPQALLDYLEIPADDDAASEVFGLTWPRLRPYASEVALRRFLAGPPVLTGLNAPQLGELLGVLNHLQPAHPNA